VTIAIPTESLASYDTETASFIMEAGDYFIRVGSHSRDTAVEHIIRLDETAILRTVRNEIKPDHELSPPVVPERKPETANAPFTVLYAADCATVDGACKTERKTTAYIAQDRPFNAGEAGKNYAMPFPCRQSVEFVRGCPQSTLPDVASGEVTMEEFVASLDEETLLRLVAGTANETKYTVPKRMKKKARRINAPSSSGATTALFTASLGIPGLFLTDGPAGLHIMGCGATCYPSGMVMAQTWDTDACHKMGLGMGKELKSYNYSVILGPGMNIHRDPLCGRSFEYYSEDPLVTGKMAAAATLGVQATPGASVALKHFACNNQEASRTVSNSTVSERALREIYLRGFEICVREANPGMVMSSYNMLNGIHTSSHYELLTEVLRGEWGFGGLVMTDWGSASEKPLDLHAGNDLIMGGYRSDLLMAALKGTPPVFAPDGYVKTETFKVFGGFMTQTVEYWNAFALSAAGKDSVSTEVAAGAAVSEKAKELAEKQMAQISERADGSKTIVYRGTDKGAYLPLGDLQKCAMSILRAILKSVSYEVMSRKAKL
jgi:beta-glucosidase